MRRALVSHRAASRLCRTCLQARLATSSRSSPIAAKPTTIPHPPRWNAFTCRSASTTSDRAQVARSPRPAQRLLFYSLFPNTLPDGPPPAGPFRIDTRPLRHEFLRLQAAAHPDFHHAASGPSDAQASAHAHASAASATINEAYKTLSSPLLRAQYLLRELHGVDLAGDEAGGVAEADPGLLMLVLEAREAIEDAGESDLAALRGTNDERIRASEAGLETAFRGDDVDAAKAEAVRLRYWINIKESLDDWEEGKAVVLQH